MNRQFKLARAARQHVKIRTYFLRRIGTEDQWRAVSADPRRFNQVWRRMLGLAPGDEPPPKAYRL